MSDELGSEAFDRRAGEEAYDLLVFAERLEVDDLAWRSPPTSSARRTTATRPGSRRTTPASAARSRAAGVAGSGSASLLLRGETARGSGWLARAERLVEDAAPACAVRGFLLVPVFLDTLEAGGDGGRVRPHW